MRSFLLFLLLGCGLVWAQDSGSASSPGSQIPANQAPATSSKMPPRNSAPPRSDRVDVGDLGDNSGESSSKDTQVDLSPPAGDEKSHPESEQMLKDEGSSAATDVSEARLWNPHKAAKDIEVGNFYFKVKKNFGAAESRYREALMYKPNDAAATFRLAESLEKLRRPDEAQQEYENYLKILPNGPEAGQAKKALERLKSPTAANGTSPH